MHLSEENFGGYLLHTDSLRTGSFASYLSDSDYGSVWIVFEEPDQELVAFQYNDVRSVLSEIEVATTAGKYAAGFFSFDSAPAFDSALVAHQEPSFPLAHFFTYNQKPRWYKQLVASTDDPRIECVPDLTSLEYLEKFDQIHKHIQDGDTYQVNFSFRMGAKTNAQAVQMRIGMAPPPYASVMETSTHSIVSLSPELFFERDGHQIRCQPMKGTRPRGSSTMEDIQFANELQASEKERAENLMVVDMIRNDLGRIAKVGTVKTPKLFEVERFATVNQMTSTVVADVDEPLSEIFRALFPCASIVGAPKVETMKIIQATEATPRALYTGAIGYAAPNSQCRFSVAIRTAWLEKATSNATYGVGSGIVWDSTAGSEYEECLLKAEALQSLPDEWALLETMLWRPNEGIWLEELHLDRLSESARQVGIPFDRTACEKYLYWTLKDLAGQDMRVRLLLFVSGRISHTIVPYVPPSLPLTARLADLPVSSLDPSLRIKTSNRTLYQNNLDYHPDCKEVLLWNENRQVTEFCNGNFAIRIGGTLVTPPDCAGLLPGVFRRHLLDLRQVETRPVTIDELRPESEIFRLNSVSGCVPVKLF